MSALAALRSLAYMGLELPALRFFTPTDIFWSMLRHEMNSGVTFVECGSGNGDLLDEAADHGFELEGWDPIKREGQSKRVIQGDATELNWGPKVWPLICRPSHDGFANEIVEKARSQGATTWFITLPRNYERSLSEYMTYRLATNIGVEGERLWAIRPLKGSK